MEKKVFYLPERDGISQTLLGKWLACRQLARYDLQGWTSKFTPASMIQGTIGHAILQHIYEAHRTKAMGAVPSKEQFKKTINGVEKIWLAENPRPSRQMLQDLEFALLFAEILLPIYFDYWKEDFKKLAWEKLEGEFKIPFQLKDGRKTFIRGKMDGVFKRNGLWLFESKFKSRIEEEDIIEVLAIDLQVMLYLWALGKGYALTPSGVLYNVVRRPGLKLGKAETLPQLGKRLEKDILKRTDFYFYRFEVATDKDDIAKWTLEFEQMVKDFMDWWENKVGHYKNTPNSCITKYGRCQFLSACVNNEYHNLTKRSTVFKELEDA